MAAPITRTTLDLSGRFVMNKTQSDSTEQILIAQGVGWLTRKAILYGTLTLDIRHYKDDTGVEHIDIDQTLTGGIPGSQEIRILDWVGRDREDRIFGAVIGKSRRIQLSEINDEFLAKGWEADVHEHGAIESYVESDTKKSGRTWIADQVWGFQIIEGERKYVRLVKFTGNDGDINVRLVYDHLEA